MLRRRKYRSEGTLQKHNICPTLECLVETDILSQGEESFLTSLGGPGNDAQKYLNIQDRNDNKK